MTYTDQLRAREQFEKLFAIEPAMTRTEFSVHPDAIEFAARRGINLAEAWTEINSGCAHDPRRVRGALRYRLVKIQAAQCEQALR